MSTTPRNSAGPHATHDVSVEAIARETSTAPAIVEQLYQDECVALNRHARIKQFVAVLATKSVKRYLRAKRIH